MSQPKHPEHSKSVVDNPSLRPLTLHERYCQMRHNTGRPQVVIHVVTYPLSALPSVDFLHERVLELQDRLPMLHAGVAFGNTNRPVYCEGYTFAAHQLVQEVHSPSVDPLDVYRVEMERFTHACVQPNDNRMWCVSRVTTDGDVGFLLLTMNHLLIDGKGTTLLLRALTSDDPLPAKEEWTQPTRFDDTIPISPSLGFLLPVVFRELLLPKAPRFIQSAFTRDDPWPGPTPSPLDKPWDIALLSLEPELISKVKAAGRAHGIATLHPLLKVAYLAAMWRVFSDGTNPLRFAAATARNERDPALGHASITHNYVSSTEWRLVLSPADGLWTRAKEFAALLASPSGLAEGRMTLGLLSHLPDPAVDPSAPDFDPTRPTGWEKYFLERAGSAIPFRCSLDMSNLGRVQLPPGARDAFWGQSATPFSAALHSNVIGHEGGVRMTTVWREGAGVSHEQVVELHRVLREVLGRMGEGEATVAEITE